MKSNNYKNQILWLIALSTIIRAILAYFIDLGSDEAYCWTFSLYPKLSQIESTPMVGWLIQLFTCNLALNNEFFVRLTSVVVGSVNTWLIFVLGRRMKNELTGFYASVLYTASLYCFISTGTFISPGTPQIMFILLSIYFLHEGFIIKYDSGMESRTLANISLAMSGLFIGLATLSHFSSILLWAGVLLYIIIFNKKAFGRPTLYIAFVITLIMTTPVILWHMTQRYLGLETLYNHIIATPDPLKEFLINNPINIIIIIISLIAFKKRRFLKPEQYQLFVCIVLPLMLTGNISNSLLPLFLIAASYLEMKHMNSTFSYHLPKSLKYSLAFGAIAISLSIAHLYFGIFNFEIKRPPDTKIGYYDISLDRYGLKELASEFKKQRTLDIAMNKISSHACIVSDNYLAAAQAEYYLAYPDNMQVKAIGNPSEIRRYALKMSSGKFLLGESAYYIESSRSGQSGMELGRDYYKDVEEAKTIYIHRSGKPVVRYTIYRFKELMVIPSIE